MSGSKNLKSLRMSAGSAVLLMTLYLVPALGPRACAQTPAQPSAQTIATTPEGSEVPPAVAKELQAVKARMVQLESQVKDLAAFVAPSTNVGSRPAPAPATLTGTVSCGHCQGIQPMHKGYTQYTWALNSISQGDDIVLVGRDQVYKLEGDKDSLLKFMSSNARVSGRLDGSTLQVESIGRVVKGE